MRESPAQRSAVSTPEPGPGDVLPRKELSSSEFGPNHVLNVEVDWEKVQEKCQGDVECLTAEMLKAGASLEAVAFVRERKGEEYMTEFQEMGKVDLAYMSVTFLANDPEAHFQPILVNGTPRIVEVFDEVWGIRPYAHDPVGSEILRRFPNAGIFHGMHVFKGAEDLAGGGQRFRFIHLLTDSCRACEIAGYVEIAFDFEANGQYLGAKVVRFYLPEEGKRLGFD